MEHVLSGLAEAVSLFSIVVLMIGICWGMVIGALPGLGLVIAVSLVLPFTYSMSVANALLLLIGTAAGAQFGNGVTAIVIGVPGSPSAVLTVVEGYRMYQRGEGGRALFLNLVAAVFGQGVGAVGFVLFILPLAAIAPFFLAPETFALCVIGMLAVGSLTSGDLLKGFAAILLGLALGFVGPDPTQGVVRFAFDVYELESGLGLVPVTIGLLGLGEFLYQLYGKKDEVQGLAGSERRSGQGKGTSLQVWGSLRTLRPFFVVAMFGAVVAFLVGVIPGLGATAATFIVYQQLRLVAKRPAELGHGSDEGLVAQNAADNAVIGGELVPTLGLGIPGSGSMAVLMGALVVQGIQPGPNVLRSRPELVGTVAAGLLLAGVALLPLGWAFSYSAMRIARLWQPAIFGTGVILILLGAYSVSNRIFEVYVIIAFGVLGFILRRHEFPVAATVIAFVLSGLLETSFRRGILMELGSISGFLMRPITASILVFGVFMLAQQTGLLRRIRPGARSLDE